MALEKITEQQMDQVGVAAAPDILNGTPAENKAIFDRMVRQLIAPAHNACVEAVNELERKSVQWAEDEDDRAKAESDRETAEEARETAEEAREAAEAERKAVSREVVEAASGAAKLAESWAKGSTGTRQGEDTNNAKYWAEQSRQYGERHVLSFNGRSGNVVPAAGDYTAAQTGAASVSHFHAGDITRHVAKTGSDETGDGSESRPYLTIQKAINSLPNVVTNCIFIQIHAGTYDEDVTLSGLTTAQGVHLAGVTGESVKIKSLMLWHNNSRIQVDNIEIIGTASADFGDCIRIGVCTSVELNNIICVQPVVSDRFGAIRCEKTPMVRLSDCTISNKPIAVDVLAATVYMNHSVTGAGNTVAIRCGSGWGSSGGFVFKGGATMEGTETTAYGGQIF